MRDRVTQRLGHHERFLEVVHGFAVSAEVGIGVRDRPVRRRQRPRVVDALDGREASEPQRQPVRVFVLPHLVGRERPGEPPCLLACHALHRHDRRLFGFLHDRVDPSQLADRWAHWVGAVLNKAHRDRPDAEHSTVRTLMTEIVTHAPDELAEALRHLVRTTVDRGTGIWSLDELVSLLPATMYSTLVELSEFVRSALSDVVPAENLIRQVTEGPPRPIHG
ncbi:hypothetical protein [Umezawaea sp. NPDC059074]|uniref:hypothetical protein n=1 Tax=Umezawaea sp. NPDC059074 TaxID=3346716 RepID=UPI00368E0F78